MATVHDAFTTRAFGDQSLIIVTDYYPLSKTLAEEHPPPSKSRFGNARTSQPAVPESILWSYIVQIAFALRVIHGTGLAAQTIHPSKVIITSKNRVRLSACGVLDIVKFDTRRPVHELQVDDLHQLGRLILSLATNSAAPSSNPTKDAETIPRSYSDEFRDCVQWLLGPPKGQTTTTTTKGSSKMPATRDITAFLASIVDHIAVVHDASCHSDEAKTQALALESENGRFVRLLAKLEAVLDRPEDGRDGGRWSETEDRRCLRLFRDHVFHQIDPAGRPVANLGHVVSCLNKLDAGVDEKVQLSSRDEQSVIVLSYLELKQCLLAAFTELFGR